MREVPALAALAAGLVAVPPAFPADCGDAATQSEMASCYGEALKAADKALNATYREIEQRLDDDPEAKKLLVAAERAWITFRDAECAFSSSSADGGGMYPTTLSICLADLTKARTRQLTAFLHCQEGDISCPVPGD